MDNFSRIAMHREDDSGDETEVIEMISSDDDDDSDLGGNNRSKSFTTMSKKKDIPIPDSVQQVIRSDSSNPVAGGSRSGNGGHSSTSQPVQVQHALSNVATTSSAQPQEATQGQLPPDWTQLVQWLQTLQSPESPEQQQQVAEILKANPQLMTAYLRHKQSQSPRAEQQGGVEASPAPVNASTIDRVNGPNAPPNGLDQGRAARRESIQRAINSLVVACCCSNPNCNHPASCNKMKRVIAHAKVCRRKTAGGCPICKQLIALCCYHAKYCQDMPCRVPFCANIKHKLRAQQVHQRYQQNPLMARIMHMQRLRQISRRGVNPNP